ncbi:pyridoxamine 5'-phosphate oxidase family protein [Acidovorax sp. Leaf160]|uniref:pyridoxamine 5'-phosphate oxidase family protein n=1 Tax=Acidovorax sp. Leaf160 TaxID=1736280 RepID=UPI0006F92A6F|nr:pyridoxamine 5'-phosphate oxidase family protein [Acidovorax sp. Leaf160]KQR42879.1 pyridoxamine 5'-phosphate oxidase [Acidovorax sp. Leaf160]
MAEMSLQTLSDAMRRIDFGMLSTRTEGGEIASRPMSNNGEVEYRGDSYFFTFEDARTVGDIERDAKVGLTFSGTADRSGGPGLFIAIEGHAELIRDKAQFAEHWTKDLDQWFEQGVDTPGVVMIKVHANRMHYWNGPHEGEIPL